MKPLILVVVIIATSLAQEQCTPKGHYWRPYSPGVTPPDAFVAGVNTDGKKIYVAKIIPLDKDLWTTPAQLNEDDAYITFAWFQSKLQKVDKFIEILCTEYSSDVHWEKVEQYPDEVLPKCCLVQGGIGLSGGTKVRNLFIGKYENDGSSYVGRTYMKQDYKGVHFIDGQNVTKVTNNFQVLTYNCVNQ